MTKNYFFKNYIDLDYYFLKFMIRNNILKTQD